MNVNLILAHTKNGIIGTIKDGVHSLPWKIPEDMRRFRHLTTGCCVIMGRVTFDSLGMEAGLPNRFNIVVTRNPELLERNSAAHPNHQFLVRYVPNYEQALMDADIFRQAFNGGSDTVWVMGGAHIYHKALQLASGFSPLNETFIFNAIYATVIDDDLLEVDTEQMGRASLDMFAWNNHIKDLGLVWDEGVPSEQFGDKVVFHEIKVNTEELESAIDRVG